MFVVWQKSFHDKTHGRYFAVTLPEYTGKGQPTAKPRHSDFCHVIVFCHILWLFPWDSLSCGDFLRSSIINVKACKTLCLEASVCTTDLYWSKNHIFAVFISDEIVTLVVFAQENMSQNLNSLQVCRCTWNASISEKGQAKCGWCFF